MPAPEGEHQTTRRESRAEPDATRVVVRRIDAPDGGVDQCEILRLIQSRTIPGLATIERVELVDDTLEVVELHPPGFNLEEARRPILDDISVTVALGVIFDIAKTMVALHSIKHEHEGHLIHGKLREAVVRLTPEGDVVVTGVEGRIGDPATDVAGVMQLMRRILEGRAKTKDGALLLDRLSALTFTNCHDLAHSIDIYLQRQDPEELVRRRRRFAEGTVDYLALTAHAEADSEEPTAALRDDEDLLATHAEEPWGALQPEGDYSRFDVADSIPTIGSEEIEDLSDEGSSTAIDFLPDLADIVASDRTIEASPTPLDIARSRQDSVLGPLSPNADLYTGEIEEDTADGDIDERARLALLARASVPPAPSERDGDAVVVGDYKVVASIGRGGMGEIYLARHVIDGHPGEHVALKVLSADGQEDEEALGMLLDEAAIMARIEHENVLRVVDFGRARGRYYLATEYLEGRPLVRVMIEAYNREAGIDYGVIAAIGADIANGLFAAHTATNDAGEPLEVVHRDVSPQNVFVTYRGVTKVLDFGVARATERVSKTAVGLVKGKAAYMSPEQAEGKDVDARSDVFSLGVCLWEMTAGQRLFKRDNEYDTLLAVQSAKIPKPTVLRGDPNAVLDHIILGALERDLTKRTSSARELALQLIDYASGVGVVDREQAVADLLERLFGESSRQERDLIASLELRAATVEEAEELRVLSGVSPRSTLKRITMVADEEGLGELDDFGTESSGQVALPREGKSVAQQVIESVQKVQAERSTPPPRAHTPQTQEFLESVQVVDDFDGEPTRRLPSEVLESMIIPSVDEADIVDEDACEGADGFERLDGPPQPPTAPSAPVPPTKSSSRGLVVVLVLLIAVVIVFGGAAYGLGWFDESPPSVDAPPPASAAGEVAGIERSNVPRGVTTASTATVATVDPATSSTVGAAAFVTATRNVSVESFMQLLDEEGVSTVLSKGTFLVDDGAGGSMAFDDAAAVTRVETPNSNGFIVQTKSKALTSVGWIGRTRDGPWRVRGLSINDCAAEVQIDEQNVAIRYGGQEVRLRHGDALLTDVELQRPERATRLEVDPLGLSFGEPDEASGVTHCQTGWWGTRVVLRRLPEGRYTLRWIGAGVSQTARLYVSPDNVDGGKLVRQSR